MEMTQQTLNREALFSDQSKYYQSPFEPHCGDRVTVTLRTAKDNVDEVYFISGSSRNLMKKTASRGLFDYYTYRTAPLMSTVRYYFEIDKDNERCFYNTLGVTTDLQNVYSFKLIPGFSTPEWAKGAVMYQIYTDRFCNGDLTNDVEDREYMYLNEPVHQVKDWETLPESMDVWRFYGGDLQGIWNKLDYLQNLGVEVLYLNPIFVSPSNHKYDSQDYDYVDPHLGVIVEDGGECLAEGDKDNTHATKYQQRVVNKKNLEASNEFFAKVVQEIHARGMKVIIDGVFNHCGSFNKWLDKEHIYRDSTDEYAPGAFERYESPYHNFFKFYSNQWPDNNSYDGWWGHDTLPKLNYEGSKELEEYILSIGRKWVSAPYNVDGWRLDVAADLGYSPEYNHYFWKRFREEVKKANPDAIILAEHYGDSYEWLQGDEWDTIMNYDAFMEPVTWFLTGMEKHSDEARPDSYGNPDYFFGAMHHNMARMGGQSVAISMNELSNHDHSRFLTRTNRTVGRTNTLGPEAANNNVNKAVFKEAVVMQMTLPGAPTVYYGDEAGVCGFTDPDNRRTYPWGHEDTELIDFHRVAIKMHKENDVLRKGSYKSLYSAYNVIAYGRFTSDDAAIIIVNNNDDEVRARIPAWEVGLGFDDDVEQLLVTFEGGYSTDRLGYHLQNGWLDIGLRKTSAVVLHKMKW
mgnify:CR=1 FL=1